MASEITINQQLSANKGYETMQKGRQYVADWSGTKRSGGIISIATTATQVVLGTGTTPAGWAFFTNLDTTNYVTLGTFVAATYTAFVKLMPGESALMRMATTTIYAQANTSAVDLEFEVLTA